jgi:hypothetical protein
MRRLLDALLLVTLAHVALSAQGGDAGQGAMGKRGEPSGATGATATGRGRLGTASCSADPAAMRGAIKPDPQMVRGARVRAHAADAGASGRDRRSADSGWDGELFPGARAANGVTYTLTVENWGLQGKGLTTEELTVALTLPAAASIVETSGAGYQETRRTADATAGQAVWRIPRLGPK